MSKRYAQQKNTHSNVKVVAYAMNSQKENLAWLGMAAAAALASLAYIFIFFFSFTGGRASAGN